MPAAVTTALLLILAFPPFDVGWTAWIALIPWLLELEHATPRRAFLLSFLTGFLFFLGTVWWVGHVTVPGMLVLVAYLALYFGVWGWFAQHVLKREIASSAARPPRNDLLVALPAAWGALEFLRSFLLSGFGWNLLAHTQWNWIPLIQIADVTGVWGVSFLVMLANVALFQAISSCHREERDPSPVIASPAKDGTKQSHDGFGTGSAISWRWPFAMTLVCFAGVLGYGLLKQKQFDACSSRSGFKVALVQGNVPQSQKWDEVFQESIWKRYEQLTTEAAGRKPELIVWPETAVPGFLEEASIRQRLEQRVLSAGRPLLAGVPTEDGTTDSLYNSAVLFSPDGVEKGRYNKLHLVPFGEFIPLKPVLGWLQNVVPIGDFSAGREFVVFHPAAPVQPFSVLICFEDLFPGMSRRFVRAGARWLLVITNDGWFSRSAASLQHLQASVFRAVENRVWMGRAANTGWTGFIDPLGRRLPKPGQIPRFKAGVATAELPAGGGGESPYNRWGDWFPLLCLGLAAWAIMKPSD